MLIKNISQSLVGIYSKDIRLDEIFWILQLRKHILYEDIFWISS